MTLKHTDTHVHIHAQECNEGCSPSWWLSRKGKEVTRAFEYLETWNPLDPRRNPLDHRGNPLDPRGNSPRTLVESPGL